MTSNQLPGLVHTDGLNQFRLSQFYGYDHRLAAQNGYIWDMMNLTGDYAPVLASRPRRWTVRAVAKPNGLYCSGKLILVDGTALTVDGQTVGQVADSRKQMQGMSGRVVIWPDKLIITREGELESLEASCSASGLVFGDGEYAGQEAEANSITTTGEAFPFQVGDAVEITDVGVEAEKLTLYTNETNKSIAADPQPGWAGNRGVFYESSEPSVVTVDAAGRLTPVGAGKATVTVSAACGTASHSVEVTVEEEPQGGAKKEE